METSTACIYWAYSNTTLSILQSDHQILWYRSNCMVWYMVRNVYKQSPCRLSISSSEVVGDLKGERLDGLIEALQKIRVGVVEQPIGRGCVREAGCWSEMLWGHVLRLWFKRLQQGSSRLGYSVFFCVWFFFFYPLALNAVEMAGGIVGCFSCTMLEVRGISNVPEDYTCRRMFNCSFLLIH